MIFPKKQAQRLIPEYLLDYTTKLNESHPDPTESWGGSGGSNYTAGDGITIANDVISVDNTIAKKSEIPTNYVTLDTEQTITGLKTIGQTSGTLSEVDFSGFTFKLVNKAINSTEAEIKISNSSYDGNQHPHIYSTKGLYVNLAKIRLGDDGSNTYGITMPDSTTWESDRVLATIDDIPTIPTLATVATTGSYNDLLDKPTFATVATSGSYNDLTDKPTIPDTSNLVTTDTMQTMNGFKTFIGDLKIENTFEGRSITYTGLGSFVNDYLNNQSTIERSIFDLPTSKPSGTESKPTKYTLATTDDIPDTTNFVTTNTDQAISGSKTFDSGKLKVSYRDGKETLQTIITGWNYTFVDQNNETKRMLFGLNYAKTPGTVQKPTQYLLATQDDINDAFITFTQGGTTKGQITLNQSEDQTIEFDAGSVVVANPTLSGGEATLTGLEVDGVKYAISGGGGSSAPFEITNMQVDSSNQTITLTIVANS